MGAKYNKKKSQVLIVGKRCTEKQWILDDDFIGETNTYKYLGVIMSRQLKDNNHVNDHLSTKVNKTQIPCQIYTCQTYGYQ